MKKITEDKAVEKLVESIADIRFNDSTFALSVLKQPPRIQRRIMKLFLTMVRFWGVDHKYVYHIHKDDDTAEVAYHIDRTSIGPGSVAEQILDGSEPPVVEYNYNETEAVNLDNYYQ